MEEIINQLLDNDLRELKGMKVAAKIPVDPDLVNEVIAKWLRSGPADSEPGASADSATEASSGASALPTDKLPDLLRRHVKKLEFDIENDKMMVYFEFRVEE